MSFVFLSKEVPRYRTGASQQYQGRVDIAPGWLMTYDRVPAYQAMTVKYGTGSLAMATVIDCLRHRADPVNITMYSTHLPAAFSRPDKIKIVSLSECSDIQREITEGEDTVQSDKLMIKKDLFNVTSDMLEDSSGIERREIYAVLGDDMLLLAGMRGWTLILGERVDAITYTVSPEPISGILRIDYLSGERFKTFEVRTTGCAEGPGREYNPIQRDTEDSCFRGACKGLSGPDRLGMLEDIFMCIPAESHLTAIEESIKWYKTVLSSRQDYEIAGVNFLAALKRYIVKIPSGMAGLMLKEAVKDPSGRYGRLIRSIAEVMPQYDPFPAQIFRQTVRLPGTYLLKGGLRGHMVTMDFPYLGEEPEDWREQMKLRCSLLVPGRAIQDKEIRIDLEGVGMVSLFSLWYVLATGIVPPSGSNYLLLHEIEPAGMGSSLPGKKLSKGGMQIIRMSLNEFAEWSRRPSGENILKEDEVEDVCSSRLTTFMRPLNSYDDFDAVKEAGLESPDKGYEQAVKSIFSSAGLSNAAGERGSGATMVTDLVKAMELSDAGREVIRAVKEDTGRTMRKIINKFRSGGRR